MSEGTTTSTAAQSSGAAAKEPPRRPVLSLRVGVSGHRDLDEAARERVRAAVNQVLALVERVVADVAGNPDAGYDGSKPRLVAVSPLAKGADQVFAQTALDRRQMGWELHVPMPFPRMEYEKDFKGEGLKEFENLMSSAVRKLELDGSREAAKLAYLHVGRTVLHQSDILVAVWDGTAAERIGGTAQIVDEAYSHQIPVVWVDPWGDGPTILLSHPPREGPSKEASEPLETALRDRLREILLPPEMLRGRPNPAGRLGPNTYYKQLKTPRLPFFQGFRAMVIGRPPRGMSPDPKSRPNSPDYLWADNRATLHADNYRSAFTITYLFGALAVLCALLGYSYTNAVYTELGLTLTAIALVTFALRGHWHDLWLDERLLAERFRQMHILQPLGLSAPGTRVPRAEREPGEEDRTLPDELWASWLFRAHARTIPMPEGNLNDSLEAHHEVLLDVLRSQAEYHDGNVWRLHRLRHRLHYLALGAFLITVAICLAHLFMSHHALEESKNWRTLLAGFLPAFASALAGIIGHGEFQRLERNSAATRDRLRRLIKRLETLTSAGSYRYAAIAEDAAQLMLSELLAWHVLISDRPLQVGH
jgi:hypothetical protein